MNNKILVSVNMISYKHEAFVKKAVEGVLMQETNFEYDLIIADDCSPDDTEQIINEIITKHPKGNIIKYYKHKKNLGILANWQFALEKCEGKYIALCEGDDFWTDPLKLQRQVDFLEKNDNFALVFHDVNLIDANDKILKEGYVKNKERIRTSDEIVSGSLIPTCSVLFRNCINLFPKNFSKVKNGDSFLFAILGHLGKGYFMSEIKNASYRVHEGGVWSFSSNLSKKMNQFESFKEIKKYSHRKFYASLNLKLASNSLNLFKMYRTLFKKFYFLANTVKYFIYYFLNKFFKIYV